MRALLSKCSPLGGAVAKRLRGLKPADSVRVSPHPRLRRYFPQWGKTFFIAIAAVFCIAAASDPAERLHDPAQEARARALFTQVRCLVCQNESIDDSEAQLAGDLRKIIRRQVAAGRSDAQIRQFLVARYGEFVLLKPPFSLGNLALWAGPFVVVLAGGLLLLMLLRRRAAPDALSAEEEDRLSALLQDGDN